MTTCCYLKNEEPHHADDNEREYKQKSADYQIGRALLLRLRAGDAEGVNKQLCEIGKQLHESFTFASLRIKAILIPQYIPRVWIVGQFEFSIENSTCPSSQFMAKWIISG